METNEENENLEMVVVRIPSSKKKSLKTICAKRNIYEADFIRDCINMGLNIKSYEDNLQFLVDTIENLINSKLDPFIKSQRQLNAKYTRSAAINTYLIAEVLERILPDYLKTDFATSLEKARKKANLYVNKKIDPDMEKEDILSYYKIGELY